MQSFAFWLHIYANYLSKRVISVLNLPHLPSAISGLNQVMRTDIEEGAFDIHYWDAHPSHVDNLPHKHSFFEVCYVADGEGIYEEEGLTFALQSGDLFCSRPGRQHRIHQCRALGLLWFSFEGAAGRPHTRTSETCARLAEASRYFVRGAAVSPVALAWQALLQQAGRSGEAGATLRYLANGLLSALIRELTGLDCPESRSAVLAPHDPLRLVQRARTFIADNLSPTLRLQDVADHLHLSQRTVSRLFSQHGGLTFVQHLQAERLRRAERLLLETDHSIKSIATDAGFDSVHYFTRAFAGHYHLPPGEYRTRKRGEKGGS